MYKINLLLGVVLVGFVACSKSANTTTDSQNNNTNSIASISMNFVQSGSFMNAVHATSGEVGWVRTSGKDTLVFKNFKTDAGPDLKVYLSTDSRASSFINLGDLKSVNGNQFYTIPPGKEPADYKYVLIWCQRFSVLFGSAELK